MTPVLTGRPEAQIKYETDDDFRLFDIAARLATIESNLQINRATSYTPDSPQLDSPHSMEHDSSEPGFLQPAGIFSQVSSVAVAVERVVGATARFNEGHSDYGAPDAIKRGIVTVEQSQELFDFFFTELHPWIMMLSLEDDRDAMVVR